jgi:hypothetical protein
LLGLTLAVPAIADAQLVVRPPPPVVPPPVVVPFPTVAVRVHFPPPPVATATLPPLAATQVITIGGTAPAPSAAVSGAIPAATTTTVVDSTAPGMNAAADAAVDTNMAVEATPATPIQAPERAPAAVNVTLPREPLEAADGDGGECDAAGGNRLAGPDDCAGNGMRLEWWMIALSLAIGALLLLWLLKIRRR